MRSLQFLIVCVVLVTALGAAAEQSALLTGEELRAEIVGVELEGRRLGVTIKILHDSDGTSTIRSRFRNRDGTWEIVGNQLCVTWQGEAGTHIASRRWG